MKILMASRRSSAATLGGDTVQIQSLAGELEKLGHSVQIDFDGRIPPSEFDIVHIFNLDRPQDIIPIATKAKSLGKPVVLTPVFVDYREFDVRGRTGVSGKVARIIGAEWMARAKILGRAVRNGEFHAGTSRVILSGLFRMQQDLLKMVDFILPNSVSEMRRLATRFGIEMDTAKWLKVENGVDPRLFRMESPESGREGVLCVARVEGLKNQLNLVRAMEGLPWNLTLIGDVAPNHKSYLARVLKDSGNNVRYLGPLPQAELPEFYQQAKVHVLPSWFETTGLSSLEAAAMGCNIVVTGKGDTEEYFKDAAFYCEPDDVESIRNAILRAYKTPLNEKFKSYILENCTWEKAAGKTLRVYNMIARANGATNDHSK
jgi:glycosyltransferase involved in cell wall biosynthesis